MRHWIMMLGALCTVLPAARTNAQPPAAPRTAAKGAIEPVAPVVPAEVVAAMQGGEYETRAPSSDRARRKGQGPRRRRLLCLSSGDRRAALRASATPPGETLRKAIQADPDGPLGGQDPVRAGRASSWPPGNWAAAEELARAEAVRLLAGDRKDRLAEVYHDFARRLLEPDDPLIPARPERRLRAAGPGPRPGQEPGAPRPAPLRDGPRQPGGRQPRPGDRELPGLPPGVSRRGRPLRRPVPARRGPAQGQPAPAGPADLDRSGPRHRAHSSRPSSPRSSPPSGPTRSTRSRRPTEFPIRPTTPA